ncbi:MAG: hypothetical protein Q9157_001856 [Trypethelium eluteriae]
MFPFVYLSELSTFSLCLLGVTTWVLWLVGLVIHRLYFHRFAKVPGPRLAIVTYWYETYYEIVKPARYSWKVGELHEQYGPIIRINPSELHINDPDYYDTIYTSARHRVDKPPKSADSFGPVPATFGTGEHELHRIRRAPLNKHFSKKSVGDLQPWIFESFEKLCGRLKEAYGDGAVVNLKYAYSAVARDIIDQYCFSRRTDSVSMPDFNMKYNDALEEGHHMTPIGWLTKMINPGFGQLLDEMERVSEQVEDMRVGKYVAHKHSEHPTVLKDLLESDLPQAEKKKNRIRAEAQTLIGAGTSTVALVLTTTTCHLEANPTTRLKLFQELQAAIPDPSDFPPLQDLEQLPYLTAVILEGHRVSHAASHRLLRSFPSTTFTYGNTVIPPGTTISMTPLLIHQNPDIFPDPAVFKPERWLGPDAQKLKRYLVPFGKGTRMCIGSNLANAELYIGLAMVFREFNFELVDVVPERDYVVSRDTVIGSMSAKSKGVTTLVKLTADC